MGKSKKEAEQEAASRALEVLSAESDQKCAERKLAEQFAAAQTIEPLVLMPELAAVAEDATNSL